MRVVGGASWQLQANSGILQWESGWVNRLLSRSVPLGRIVLAFTWQRGLRGENRRVRNLNGFESFATILTNPQTASLDESFYRRKVVQCPPTGSFGICLLESLRRRGVAESGDSGHTASGTVH